MADTYKRKYGLDWPKEVSDFQIELTCAKKWREKVFLSGSLTDPADHMLRAIRMVFPPGNSLFVISPWTEQHVYDWTHEDFCITWGCASSSKALRLDAVVFTPTGPKTMGELEVGDKVIAQDGKTASVIRTHLVGARITCGKSKTGVARLVPGDGRALTSSLPIDSLTLPGANAIGTAYLCASLFISSSLLSLLTRTS
jgi:hypothetical protein